MSVLCYNRSMSRLLVVSATCLFFADGHSLTAASSVTLNQTATTPLSLLSYPQSTSSGTPRPITSNHNLPHNSTGNSTIRVPLTHSTLTTLPEVSSSSASAASSLSACPEYCVCSQPEDGLLTCNGEHLFPFPGNFSRYIFNLSRLMLENFRKNDLRPADLEELTGAREIRLPRNGIASVKNGLFTAFKGLKRLDLSGNKLSLITNLTFIGLRSLLYLDLSSNRIAAIDLGSFAYLAALIQLDLNSNKLTQLPNDLFTGLDALQYLNLEVNQIVQLQPRVMAHVPRLVHLNLAMNTRLDAEALELVDFGDLLNLQYCDLSNCGLTEVPQNLRETIRDIRLTGNKLNTLTAKSFRKYPALAVLVMDECNITHLADDVFINLTSLHGLWMNGNGLQSVPRNLPASLKGLYLDENNIKFLARLDVDRLVELEEIRLQRNQITTIESCAFCDLSHLAIVDLRGNRLDTLNTVQFPPVNQLSRLDLSLNPLRAIGADFFQHLRALKQLEMSRVNTLSLDMSNGIFTLLPHLTALDLSGSPVLVGRFFEEASAQRLSSTFLRHLHSLNIRAGELSIIDEHLKELFSRIPKIKMAQNELGCFLENRWLLDMIRTEQKRFYKPQELKCASPKHLKDRKIVSLDTSGLELQRIPRPAFSGPSLTLQRSHFPAIRQANGNSASAEDQSRSWMITFIACLMTASAVSLVFLVVLSCCSLEKVRLKRISLCNKVSRLIGLTRDPFPEMLASNRTLYRSQDDSIFMIGTDSPYPAMSPYEELDQRVFKSNAENIYENDCVSAVSTIRSTVEIRV